MKDLIKQGLKILYIPISDLHPAEYNPRSWNDDAIDQLKESIKHFGLVDPFVVNAAPKRKNIVIGGHFRLKVAKDLEYKTVPVVYVTISDIQKEKELNLRLNKNVGDFNWELLSEFGEELLKDVGFSSEELDKVFDWEENPEEFDLQKELQKLNIENIAFRKGDVYQLGSHQLMCGDSTVENDVLTLMNGEKADFCFTDEPYVLNYLQGKKRHGKATEGFGFKRDRRYLETESLPHNFMDLWMANINKVQKNNFSIISFENWKNLKDMWITMEKYWKIRNVIIWHCPNRTQGFAAKYKFFSKYDIAILGTSGNNNLNHNAETELLQNEYEAAIFATSGKPHWESYEKGKKICPTDFIEFKTEDEKSSGQGIIFGTKPLPILIPYIKVLTRRGDLIVEPFGGSGSTLIAAEKLGRRCFIMEKVPTYCEVIKHRFEKLTGKKATKIYGS